MGSCRLPIELIEMIIDRLSPPGDVVAVPASHISTRTLYSCLTVCKPVFSRSQDLLYGKCLYIDSLWRLLCLIRSYDNLNGTSIARRKRGASTSMYLTPFSSSTINESQVVKGIDELFELLGGFLRRLVVDIPFRSHYPDERGGPEIRVPLRNAFSKLFALEEFVSVRDELYLSTTSPTDYSVEPPVWTKWQHLQKLALYDVDNDEHTREHLRKLHNLKALVLTRADGLEELAELVDALSSSTKIIIVNVWAHHQPEHRKLLRYISTTPSWSRARVSNPRGNASDASATVQVVCVDDIDLNGGFDALHIRVCQSWVKHTALDGTLWG